MASRMDRGEMYAVAELNRAFTAVEIRNAARSAGVRNFSTKKKAELSLALVRLGYTPADVRRAQRKSQLRQSSMPGMFVYEDPSGNEAQVLLDPGAATITAPGVDFTPEALREIADLIEQRKELG